MPVPKRLTFGPLSECHGVSRSNVARNQVQACTVCDSGDDDVCVAMTRAKQRESIQSMCRALCCELVCGCFYLTTIVSAFRIFAILFVDYTRNSSRPYTVF